MRTSPYPTISSSDAAVHRSLDAARAYGVQSIDDLFTLALDLNASSDDRKSAVHMLGWLGDQAALPTLASALDDPNRRVREAALSALGSVRGQRGIERIIEAMRTHVDVDMRRRAVTALMFLLFKGHDEVLPVLLNTLRDSHHSAVVRAEVVNELWLGPLIQRSQYVANAFRQPLLQALSDSAPEVQIRAIRALREVYRRIADRAVRKEIICAVEQVYSGEDKAVPEMGWLRAESRAVLTLIDLWGTSDP